MGGARRIYRRLLRLYPARFREEYERPLEQQFGDEYRLARGCRERALVWLRALGDLATSVPGEIAHELSQDLRYSVRTYRRRSFSTVLAFAALALAIGATTGIFSVLNALLLRSLPFRDGERLVEVQGAPVPRFESRADFYAWRAHRPYLEDAALYGYSEMNVGLSGDSAHVYAAQTSANFFELLGVDAEVGRTFAAEEDVPGRSAVAVIGHGLWQQRFGGDRRAVGMTIRLNGVPMTVIGVAPRGFDFPSRDADHRTSIWTPTVFDRNRVLAPGFIADPIGRLKPELSLAQARARFEAEVRQLDPESLKREERYRSALVPLRDRLAGPVQRASLVLMGVVAFVLLIACANVAHLLLSRVTERRQEFAIRGALGASRARLVQQLITEGIALTLAAAAGGIAVAHWASRLASTIQPTQTASQEYTLLDWRVLGFAVAVAVLTGVVFGVLPAWLIGRLHDPRLAQSRTHGSGVRRMRRLLVALQAAVTVVLLAGSLSLGRSFSKLVGTDLGFRTDNVVTMTASLTGTRHATEPLQRQYFRDTLERLRAVPGVESAGAVMNLPLTDNAGMISRFAFDDRVRGALSVTTTAIAATPDYFRSIGMNVVAGREFTAADRQDSAPVAIVNEAFAQELGATTGLVGRELTWWGSRAKYRIVGVVKTARSVGPARPGWPHFYYPLEQRPRAAASLSFMTLVARVRGEAGAYLAVCRDAVQQVDPEVPVYDVKTLEQRLRDNLGRPRFYTTAILFFAGFALLLAVIGTYGVATHWIAQRTQEIGVRIAVGASPRGLRAMVLRQSLLPIAVGMALGAAGAIGLGRFLSHLVSPVEPVGAWTSAVAALLLAVTGGVAVWKATGRIVEIDPIAALKAE